MTSTRENPSYMHISSIALYLDGSFLILILSCKHFSTQNGADGDSFVLTYTSTIAISSNASSIWLPASLYIQV
jgi:hypothetical protein